MLKYQDKLYNCTESEGYTNESILANLDSNYVKQINKMCAIDRAIHARILSATIKNSDNAGNVVINGQKLKKLKGRLYSEWAHREACSMHKKYGYSMSDFLNFKDELSFWAELINRSKNNKNETSTILSNMITFNQAIAIVLNLDFFWLTQHGQKTGDFFNTKNDDEAFNIFDSIMNNGWQFNGSTTLHMPLYLCLRNQCRVQSLNQDFPISEINTKEFFDWAVEKDFLKVVKNPNRLIREGVAKDLFKKLKEENYIPKESVFDNQWEWKKTDKSLAYLAYLLSIEKIISSAKKYQELAAYIPKAENPNSRNALRRMRETPNKDKKDLEEIVNSLPKK